MTRIIGRPVPVKTSKEGDPVAFRYKGWRRVARILDRWNEAGEWWEGKGERKMFRVWADGGGVFELELDPASGRWSLYKAYD